MNDAQFKQVIEHANNTDDPTIQYACARMMIEDYPLFKNDLLLIVENKADFFRGDIDPVRDIAAFAVFYSKDPSTYGILAEYYASKLQDTNYHTYNYLQFVEHRHGGGFMSKGLTGNSKYIQFRCPMDELIALGTRALPAVINLLDGENGDVNEIAAYLIDKITGDNIPLDIYRQGASAVRKHIENIMH